MNLTKEELQEFSTEAHELLDQAEEALLAMGRDNNFLNHYNAIFRAFHSIKGTAGMLQLTELQSLVHKIESVLVALKSDPQTFVKYLSLLLSGVDSTRKLLAGTAVSEDFKNEINTLFDSLSAPKKEQPKPMPSQPLGKIIIVDDEPEVPQLIKSILDAQGFECLATNFTEEALGALSSFEPDLVLTDYRMPTMTGLDILKSVRSFNPILPVIMLSGCVTKEILLESIANGIYTVLEKPVESKVLIRACEGATRNYHIGVLANKAIDLLLYQFSEYDEFLKTHASPDYREEVTSNIKALLVERRKLNLSKKERKAA